MTSNITADGLLHFSLRTMTDDWSSPRSSSVYQQREAVFLEASVEAPLHPPLRVFADSCVITPSSDPCSSPNYKVITEHGCLVDSMVSHSHSRFHPRAGDESALRFSVHTFQCSAKPGDQIFISCHLRATLRQTRPDQFNKACFFHRPSFSWRATEGDGAVCLCCHTGTCSVQTQARTSAGLSSISWARLDTVERADAMVGPLQTLPSSYWTGHLSITHEGDLKNFNLS